jgi:hypothetical protein
LESGNDQKPFRLWHNDTTRGIIIVNIIVFGGSKDKSNNLKECLAFATKTHGQVLPGGSFFEHVDFSVQPLRVCNMRDAYLRPVMAIPGQFQSALGSNRIAMIKDKQRRSEYHRFEYRHDPTVLPSDEASPCVLRQIGRQVLVRHRSEKLEAPKSSSPTEFLLRIHFKVAILPILG